MLFIVLEFIVVGSLHLVAAVESTARQSAAGPTSPEQQKMMSEKKRARDIVMKWRVAV